MEIKIVLICTILFLMLIFVDIGCADGIAPEEEWNKTFGGTNWDYAYSVQQTTDGGYILAGHTGSYDEGDTDFWLVKTDPDGIEQWNKTFGGTNWDPAYSVQQTTDGSYILAGSTWSYGACFSDFWLIKVSRENNDWKNGWVKNLKREPQSPQMNFKI